MFSKEVLNQAKKMEEEWLEQCRRTYGDQEWNAETTSGIQVKPVYSAVDIEDLDYQLIGMPGAYPYTRGNHPLQYQFRPWANQFGLGYGLPEHTRERYDRMCQEGMSSYLGLPVYFVPLDLAAQAGYDPDHPAARGLLGQCGPTVSTMRDIEILFDGLPLDKTIVFLGTSMSAIVALAMYVLIAEQRGFPAEKLRGNVWNYPWNQWHWDTAGYPPDSAFKMTVEVIKYCSRHMPYWRPMALQSYNMEEAGANAIQEVAFILASSIAVTEECLKAGIDPDTFLPRFGFEVSLTTDFFETIAKLRALRRMWAKINKERFGCKNPRSLWPSFYLQTAGSSLTAQQPLNNIVRLTLETLAGVLSGGDGIWTVGYDEALALPTEESAVLSLRLQQILQHETNICNVSDPLGGSYYLEWLTKKIEDEAFKLIAQIDQLGYKNAWESGWFKAQIQKSATEKQRAIESEKRVVVGVNKYTIEEPEIPVPVFEIDPEVERVAIERVQAFRKERDNAVTKDALANLKKIAREANQQWPSGPDLMPAVMASVKARATMGEVMDVLKEVYGWGYC